MKFVFYNMLYALQYAVGSLDISPKEELSKIKEKEVSGALIKHPSFP